MKWITAILTSGLLLAGCGEQTHQVLSFTEPKVDGVKTQADPAQPFTRVETEHFVILSQAGQPWNRSAGPTLESFHKEFKTSFQKWGVKLKEPTQKLTWLCFADYEGFDAYARREDKIDSSWTSGYYSPRTNRVAVVDPDVRRTVRLAIAQSSNDDKNANVAAAIGEFDIARLRHEAAHQLAFNCGLQTRGVMYPFWLSEGLATNFEAESGASTGDSIRACRLLEIARRGDLMDLDDLIVLARPKGNAAEIWSQYLQAWGLFRFLVQTRPGKMRQYLASLSRTRPGKRSESNLRREFRTAFGATDKIQAEWTRFAKSPESGRLLK